MKSLQSLPLRSKLFAITLSAILMLAAVLTWRSYQGITQLSNDIAAVSIIDDGSKKAESAMESTRSAHTSLHEVVQAISEISDHIDQVATAAEEQSSVSEDITRNLTDTKKGNQRFPFFLCFALLCRSVT